MSTSLVVPLATPVRTRIGTRAVTYDKNGNNTGSTFRGDNRVQIWDDENRHKEVDRNGGMLAKYRYDDRGERKKRQTAAGDAWYVNQYFALLPNNMPTKHIFAGETRIATKTDAINMQTPLLNFYHSDHLGTTGYTTSTSQNLVQHERYFGVHRLDVQPVTPRWWEKWWERADRQGREAGGSHPSRARARWRIAGDDLMVRRRFRPLRGVPRQAARAPAFTGKPMTGYVYVAAQVGYESPTAFSGAFRRHLFVSPGQYRNAALASAGPSSRLRRRQ